MKNTLKRTLSVMLVIMMVISCFTGMNVFAANGEDPYEDLKHVSKTDTSSTDTSYTDVSGSDKKPASGSDISGSDVSDSDVSGSDVSGSDVSGSDVSGSDIKSIVVDSGNEDKSVVSCLGGIFEAVVIGTEINHKVALFNGTAKVGNVISVGSDKDKLNRVTIESGTFVLPANNTDKTVEYVFRAYAPDTADRDITSTNGKKVGVVSVAKKTDMLEVTPDSISFTEKGGSVEIVLKLNCGAGKYLADSSWITADQLIDSNNKPVMKDGGVVIKVTAAANTGLARENILTFCTVNNEVKDYVPYKVEVKITQDGIKGADRLSGKDRIETAVAISKEGWAKADTVILASGVNYADALAGAPLAAAANAPVLLTLNKTQGIEQAVLDEIARLGATKVYILGGTAAVCSDIESAVSSAGCKVTRLYGSTRYGTAVKVAEELNKLTGKKFTNLYFASGVNFPDALSISSVAAIEGNPILYMPAAGKVDSATAKFISDGKYKNGVILGGTAAVSAEGQTSLTDLGLSIERISGADRYATSQAINKKYDALFTGKQIAVATGANFPDALAGGALCAKMKMPVVLVSDKSADSALAYIKGEAPEGLLVFGGAGAVSEDVAVKLAGGVKLPAVADKK